MSEKDSQSDKYLLTINNPKEKGMTHEKIAEILVTSFKTLDYFCMADEMGTTYHTHVFIYFRSRVRFATIKKHFPEAHIDACRGLASQNIDYVRKAGKWKDSDKSETSIEGTFEEFGNRPSDSKGRRDDMTELFRMVEAGMSNAAIISENQDYILQIDKIDKLRTTLLTEKYKNTRRLDLRVTYISGATGTGKTRGVLDKHGDSNVYRVTDYEHPFDGYNMQSVLVFDEFRSSLKISDMLDYMDIYPIELPARYANKYACYEIVYIISNDPLESQYPNLNKETLKAFYRRIHEVHVHNSTDNIRIYHSVQEYLNRDSNDGFIPVTEAEQMYIPFD